MRSARRHGRTRTCPGTSDGIREPVQLADVGDDRADVVPSPATAARSTRACRPGARRRCSPPPGAGRPRPRRRPSRPRSPARRPTARPSTTPSRRARRVSRAELPAAAPDVDAAPTGTAEAANGGDGRPATGGGTRRPTRAGDLRRRPPRPPAGRRRRRGAGPARQAGTARDARRRPGAPASGGRHGACTASSNSTTACATPPMTTPPDPHRCHSLRTAVRIERLCDVYRRPPTESDPTRRRLRTPV